MAEARRWVGETYYPLDKELTLAGLRLRAGLTQKALASAMGLSQPNIARLEAGTHAPSSTKIPLLAEALGASIEDVVKAIEAGKKRRQDGHA